MEARELSAFLARPFTAVVAVAWRDGRPGAIPVWFRHDEGAVHIWSDSSRAWVRALSRDPRCTVTVAEHEAPFAAAVLRGRAKITRGDQETVLAEARRICARYLAPAELDAYMEQWAALDTIVSLPIESVRAWGRGY